FMSWQPNIHSSLFFDTFRYLEEHAGVRGIEAVIKAYRLYLEHVKANGLECVLKFTRAWSLVRFVKANMLRTVGCAQCSGKFIVHSMDLHDKYVCGMCHVPSRAGKTRKSAAATQAQRAAKAPATRAVELHQTVTRSNKPVLVRHRV